LGTKGQHATPRPPKLAYAVKISVSCSWWWAKDWADLI